MSMGYSPGLAGRGLNSGLSQANNNLNQGTNNIGQVYQDMGQNYQQFGQAYQQATQAANQLRSASTTQQQQMNQYLQALQTALGGMSTAGQNTTNQQPMGQPGFSNGGINMPMTHNGSMGDTGRFNAGQALGATGEQGLNAGQQGLINAQTQAFTGTMAPAYTQSGVLGGEMPTLTINQAGGLPNNNAYQQAVGGAQDIYAGLDNISPLERYQQQFLSRGPTENEVFTSTHRPLDYYNQYANVVFGQPGTAYTPGFQG